MYLLVLGVLCTYYDQLLCHAHVTFNIELKLVFSIILINS